MTGGGGICLPANVMARHVIISVIVGKGKIEMCHRQSNCTCTCWMCWMEQKAIDVWQIWWFGSCWMESFACCIHTEVNIAKDLSDTKVGAGWWSISAKSFVHLPHHDRITPFFLPLGTEFIKNMLPIRRESQRVTGKQTASSFNLA